MPLYAYLRQEPSCSCSFTTHFTARSAGPRNADPPSRSAKESQPWSTIPVLNTLGVVLSGRYVSLQVAPQSSWISASQAPACLARCSSPSSLNSPLQESKVGITYPVVSG